MTTASSRVPWREAVIAVTDSLKGDIVREFGYLPMVDGVRLAYVLYRRSRAVRCPAIVCYSVYAQSATSYREAKAFLDAGYAYIGVNVRGSGASEGEYSYCQPVEADDGVEIIEWAACQPWCDGNIGMVGPSYGAHTQIKVAARQPPHLRAIVPIAVEGSEYRDEAMVGGIFNAALMADWSFRIQPGASRAGMIARQAAGDRHCTELRAAEPRNRAYREVLEHPLIDAWWHARTSERMAVNVTVPTLLIHAWQDECIAPNGAIRLFAALKTTSKRLILQNGPHQIEDREVNTREQMRWLERWVKGEDNGVDREPPVMVLWEVAKADETERPAWISLHTSWPPAEVAWTTFYLSKGGELTRQGPPADEAEIFRYHSPGATEGIDGIQSRANGAPYPARYVTPKMGSDIAILGSAELTLYVSTNASDTDLMLLVQDVDQEGARVFLQKTALRASMRAVDSAVSSEWELVQSFDRVDLLTPGVIYEIALSIPAFGHVVRQGHRLELTILAKDVINIHYGKRHPSKARIPIVVGEISERGLPGWVY